VPDTEIIIVAPDSANAGDTVPVEVKITNISAGTIDVLPGFCSVNGEKLFLRPVDEILRTLGPGQSASWHDDFTMPGSSVTVHIESWWERPPKALHRDNIAEKNIELKEGGPIVPESSITIDAPSDAAPGETVNFSVTVKNTNTQDPRVFETECWAPDQAPVNKVIEIIPGDLFQPGESKTYHGSFVMPNMDAEIFVWITWMWFPQRINDNWALQVVESITPSHEGTITRKELKYDTVTSPIPVS